MLWVIVILPADMSQLAVALGMVKDLVITSAAAIGAYVAIKGLKAWRFQLGGQARFELARDLLRAVYKVRDEIIYVRSAIALPAELRSVDHAAAAEGRDPDEVQYERRWRSVGEALSDMRAKALEAEVLWDSEIRERTNSVEKCAARLHVAIWQYLRLKRKHSNVPPTQAELEQFCELEQTVFRIDGEDDFSKQVEQAVGELEGYLRNHVRLE